MTKFKTFIAQANKYYLSMPALRLGQAYFISLQNQYPDLADEVVGTTRDPFYNDDKVTEMNIWLKAKLTENK